MTTRRYNIERKQEKRKRKKKHRRERGKGRKDMRTNANMKDGRNNAYAAPNVAMRWCAGGRNFDDPFLPDNSISGPDLRTN